MSFADLARALAFVVLSDLLFGPLLIHPVMTVLGARLGLVNDHAAHLLSSGRVVLFDTLVLAADAAIGAILVVTEARREGCGRLALLLERTNLAPGRVPVLRAAAGGALLGVALAAAIIGGLAASGMMVITVPRASAAALVEPQALLLAASVTSGFAEEVSFRGYAQTSLTRALGFWPAAGLTSAWFGYAHYGEGDPLFGAASVAAWGLFSCLALRATGNLAFSAGFHAAWNEAENAIFGSADSSFHFRGALVHTAPSGPTFWTGGTVGPEGSCLFALATAAMIATVLLRRPRGQGAGAPA